MTRASLVLYIITNSSKLPSEPNDVHLGLTLHTRFVISILSSPQTVHGQCTFHSFYFIKRISLQSTIGYWLYVVEKRFYSHHISTFRTVAAWSKEHKHPDIIDRHSTPGRRQPTNLLCSVWINGCAPKRSGGLMIPRLHLMIPSTPHHYYLPPLL